MKARSRWFLSFVWTVVVGVFAAWAVTQMVERIYEVPLRPENIRFERPWAGLLCLFALVAWILHTFLHDKLVPRFRMSRTKVLSQIRPGRKVVLRPAVTGFRTVAIALLAIALMGPQSIHARDKTEVEGIDIVLTLDVSLSMRAADIAPNRFGATKEVVDEFIQRRPNDRIGAVIFGKDAYTLLPLTVDKDALRGMLQELELGLIDGRGTAIGNAIGVSLNRLRESKAKSKVIILLTDGDSNSGNVSPEQAAEFAKAMRVRVYPVLMGSSDKTRVQQGVDLFGRPIWDQGKFPINPSLMKGVAENTGGAFFEALDRKGLERSFHQILDRLEKTEIEDAGRVYGELFVAFLAPALLLLVLEILGTTLWLRRWP